MNETERYVRRASRGLWGKARQEARAELRGAIEDKVYRQRLLGLGEAEATRAALRDLGSPGVIARDLNRIHTLPYAARAALLAGVATLLGVRALAEVPTINVTSSTPLTACKLDDATLQRFIPAERERLRAELAKPGGRERLEAECRRDPGHPNDLLKLSDLLAAFRAGGIGAEILPGTDAYLFLHLPEAEEPQAINLNEAVREVNGERYVFAGALISRLREAPEVPVRLTGLKNPVLEIGSARIRLGTSSQPVYSTNLYLFMVWDELTDKLQAVAPDVSEIRKMRSFADDGKVSSPGLSLSVPGAEGDLYAVVYGQTSEGTKTPSFALRAAQGGRVIFPLTPLRSGQPSVPRVVATLPEFFRMRAQGKQVALLYRVDASNFRTLRLTPVPAAQLRLTPPR